MRTLIATATLTLVVLSTQDAVAQTGSGQFCLSNPSGGPLCSFQTLAQCRQAIMLTSSQHCFDRSRDQGTVGSGSGSRPTTGPASPPAGDAGQR